MMRGRSGTTVPMLPKKGRGQIKSRVFGEILEDIADLLVRESVLVRGSEDQFVAIEKDLRDLHATLKVAESMGGSNQSLTTLVEEMRQLYVQAEDEVDTFINRRRRQSTWGCVKTSIFFFDGMVSKHRFRKKIMKIRAKIHEVIQRGREYGIMHTDGRTPSQPFEHLQLWKPSEVFIDENQAYVLERDKQVIQSVFRHCGAQLCVVSIFGIGGCLLANRIYNDTEIESHFSVRVWLTVPEEIVADEIFLSLATQVKPGFQATESTWTADKLRNCIHNALTTTKYLIVLDDLKTTEVWNMIQAALPDNSSGSRIVITTGNRVVASEVCPSYFHELQVLSDEESWAFFKTKVDVPAELKVVGKEIMRRCMGSPLLLSTVGAFLSKIGFATQKWSIVLEELKKDQSSMYIALNAAANALPSYLKQCLFYFGLFQEGYDIPARRLIILWVAEGLVRQERDHEKPPETIAERYLTELIEKNMIQVVKRKPDGKVKTCCMPDFQRDFWVSKAKEANFLHVSEKASSSKAFSGAFMIRRLADHLDKEDVSFTHIHDQYGNTSSSTFPSYYKNLHSFLSFDSREGDVPGEDIGNFLHKGIGKRCFQRLRVLDLERVFRPKLPESMGKLIHLRYLGLRWTYLEILPSSIDNLLNLQTLDLKHTYISILPRSLWKMKQLRHLYLSESYRSKFMPPSRSSFLTDLQTLWGAYLCEESSVDGLYWLTNLRKLGLVFQLTPQQQSIMARRILRMKGLESLRLVSICKSVKPSPLYLDTLSELENLSSLYLLGGLLNPGVMDELPHKLTELTLSLSALTEDPMPKLRKLRELRILRLFYSSYIGESMICSSGDFPMLEVLKLWKLKQLREWTVEEGALPVLRELEIRSCTRLEMIPEGLHHLVMLHELKIVDMPEEFKARLKRYQGEDWYKIERVPSISISD